MTTGKTIALTRWTFVGKVMSLLFNLCIFRIQIKYAYPLVTDPGTPASFIVSIKSVSALKPVFIFSSIFNIFHILPLIGEE